MLWLFLGAGKTAVTLTAIRHLLDRLQVYRVLVIGPKRVAETVWRQEAAQWGHLKGLRVRLIAGSPAQRVHTLLRPDCDIHVINYEAIPWLVNTVNEHFLSRGKYPPWNMVIFDEVDRLKEASGKRFQMLEKLVGQQPGGGTYFPRRLGLTGTPADNGYIDLHGQFKMLDDGARLYPDIGSFRTQWCKAGYGERTWEVKASAKRDIEARIQDVVLSMSAEDYLRLPDYQTHDVWVDLPPKLQAQYDSLEQEMVASLERHEEDPRDGDLDLVVHSTLSARAKCRQLANGAMLDPSNSGEVHLIHDLKLEALDSILHEAAGNPVLVPYLYRHDMERIKKRYSKQGYRIGYIGPGVKDVSAVVDAWNARQYNMLLSHPASFGHGLNLQKGGNALAWFGLTDDLRFYRQTNARLRRQGQSAPNVHVYRILAKGTVDVPIAALLERKTATAEDLRLAIETYRKTKRG